MWVYVAWPQIQLPTGDFPSDVEEARAAHVVYGTPASLRSNSEERMMSVERVSDDRFVACFQAIKKTLNFHLKSTKINIYK